ncbi:MAG: hypothetical protein ACERKY_05795 [Anaerolineales bacterium]
MTKDSDTGDRATIWIRRIARIWSFPIIVFALIMFAGYTWSWVTTGTADPYAVEDVSLVESLPPILMFLSVLGLGIAWRWERWGGTISLLFLLATIVVLLIQGPITQELSRAAVPYLMSLVIAIPGILFLVSWWRSSRMPTY